MRLVSLAPSHTETVFALGAQDSLAAVTGFCDHPEAARGLPRLPGWSTIKAADVLALKPDLVLTSSICQDGLRQELESAGLRLFHHDPRTLDECAAGLAALGRLLDRASEGERLRARLLDDLESIRRQTAGKPRPRVYVEEWDKPPMAAGNWVPDLVRAAGGEPFPLPPASASRNVAWEELMEFDPELVVYSICGLGLRFDPSAFLRLEGWSGLSAGVHRRAFSIDDSLFNRPGPRLGEGARLLQGLIRECFWKGPALAGGIRRA